MKKTIIKTRNSNVKSKRGKNVKTLQGDKNAGKKKRRAHFATLRTLIAIAKKLRSPTGCPWDRKKTIENLLPDLLVEVKEVEEAIQKGDMKNLREELGDVLFNMVLLCVIAEEEGKFTMDEVLKGIAEKIVSRHTWVFGKDKASTPEEALALWGKNKSKEKKGKMTNNLKSL